MDLDTLTEHERRVVQTAYKNIRKRTGELSANDPLAQAITLTDENPLGLGGQNIIFSGRINYSKIDREGYAQLFIPMRTHQVMKGNTLHDWSRARETATKEASVLPKTILEKEVRDTYEEMGVLNGTKDVAVRVTKEPKDMQLRGDREEMVIGLHHPNIAYHLASGEAASGQGYILVEMCDDHLEPARTQLWKFSTQYGIVRQVASILAKLKELGMVHRDIKPSNLLMKKHAVKLADYGSFRAEKMSFKNSTMEGNIIGTPPYMSPEQAHGEKDKLDYRSDQFSAGATLYELLTNHDPLDTAPENNPPRDILVGKARNRERFVQLPAIMKLRNAPDIQYEGMERIIARMMQLNPCKRYQDYSQLTHDLERVEHFKLPTHAPARLVAKAFQPGTFSNHHHNKRVRNAVIGTLGAAAVIGSAAAAYYFGLLDRILQ
jgi:serine/threonine protein kinase